MKQLCLDLPCWQSILSGPNIKGPNFIAWPEFEARPVLKTGLGPILIIMSGHIRAGLKQFENRASKFGLKPDTSLANSQP